MSVIEYNSYIFNPCIYEEITSIMPVLEMVLPWDPTFDVILKRVFSCQENDHRTENKLKLGIETWVTIQLGYAKTQQLSESHYLLCTVVCLCVVCELMHKYISEIEAIWAFLHTSQEVLEEPNNKYLLNTASELSSASSQWGILEKDEQATSQSTLGIKGTHEIIINNISHQMALAIGYLREYVEWLKPKPYVRTCILLVPMPCILPTVFYLWCFLLALLTIPASSHPHRCMHPSPPPYCFNCSACLLSVVLYKLSNLSGSHTPWTYSYSFRVPDPCSSLFPTQHNISWKKFLLYITPGILFLPASSSLLVMSLAP